MIFRHSAYNQSTGIRLILKYTLGTLRALCNDGRLCAFSLWLVLIKIDVGAAAIGNLIMLRTTHISFSFLKWNC